MWGMAYGISRLAAYGCGDGIRDIEVVVRFRRIMGQNPKFLVCRSCGYKPPVKRVRRRCPLCDGQMRVDREKS